MHTQAQAKAQAQVHQSMGECKTSITLKSIQRIYSINESSINFWVETNIIVCAIMMMINERKRGTRTGINLGGNKDGNIFQRYTSSC